MTECGKASYGSLMRALGKRDEAAWEAARQKYEKEYASGEQLLPWGLKDFLDSLAGLAHGEALNELAKRRGDMGAVYERAPGVIPAIVGLISRELKLSPPTVVAALGLPPLPRDSLDTLLLAVVRGLAGEVRNGTLPLARIAAAVNGDCAPHEALTNTLLAQRLHALGFPFTSHHPVSMILIPRLLPSEADTAHTRLLPSPEEPRAHEHTENGSRTE